MPNPIFDGMTFKHADGTPITGASPAIVGQPVTVTIAAHSPDQASITVTVEVHDDAGGVISGQGSFPAQVPGLSYPLANATTSQGTISGGGSSNIFSVVP